MKLYRYSPISTELELFEAIRYVHKACHRLCESSFGSYLLVAGNIGIFSHYKDEYDFLTGLRKKLTDESKHFNGKYFKLHKPIIIDAEGDIPAATYEYLYIRQPDIYRSQVGDVDFVLEVDKFKQLKAELEDQTVYEGARIYPKTNESNLDMVELFHPDVDAVSYVVTESMAQKVEDIHANSGD